MDTKVHRLTKSHDKKKVSFLELFASIRLLLQSTSYIRLEMDLMIQLKKSSSNGDQRNEFTNKKFRELLQTAATMVYVKGWIIVKGDDFS